MTSRRLTGALLVALVALTIAVARLVDGGRSAPMLGLLAGVTGCWVVGWVLAQDALLRVLVPAAVAVGAVGAVLLAPDGTSGRPLAGPVGYGNANGALCLLAVGACVLAVAALPLRFVPLSLLSVLPLLLAALTKSRAALAMSVVVAGSAGLLLVRRDWGLVAAAVLLLPVVGLLVTVALGVTHPRSSEPERALTERRVELWSESLDLVRDHGLTGVGPGRFAVTAPTARRDRDARWSHSLVLQQTAETGVWGGAALVLLLVWVCAGLRRTAVRDPRGVVGAVLLAAVLTQADIDYIAHFAVIPLLLALLLGTAAWEVTA